MSVRQQPSCYTHLQHTLDITYETMSGPLAQSGGRK
jgi:hypothetical protein